MYACSFMYTDTHIMMHDHALAPSYLHKTKEKTPYSM